MSAPGFIIEDFTVVERNSLRGFCRVRLPSGLIVHDISVHKKDGSTWASPPSKPMVGRDGTHIRDANGKPQYSPVLTFASRAARNRFSAEVIAALEASRPGVIE